MASGILKRTALMCHHEGGVYDSGWRRCVTGIGVMLEPTPFSSRVDSGTDTYDMEYDDMIGHVNDIVWVRYRDRNSMTGTLGGPHGSEDGWVHGGISIYYDRA